MGQFDRFRSDLWSFTYLAVRRVLSLGRVWCLLPFPCVT